MHHIQDKEGLRTRHKRRGCQGSPLRGLFRYSDISLVFSRSSDPPWPLYKTKHLSHLTSSPLPCTSIVLPHCAPASPHGIHMASYTPAQPDQPWRVKGCRDHFTTSSVPPIARSHPLNCVWCKVRSKTLVLTCAGTVVYL